MKMSPGANENDATRKEMTRLSARGYTKIRHVLVQLPRDQATRPSTVGKLVTERKHRALVLYLLLLTCWPWLQDRREPLAAVVWVRALSSTGGPTWSTSTLSRAWSDLETGGLISRKRQGRAMRFSPRREDAGADYRIPQGASDRWNTYFVLPDTFWLDQTFARLTFPGLAMLLVIAAETSNKAEIDLAYEWGKERYGLSAKTVQNGIKDLTNHGLVHVRREQIPAPLSPTGSTTRTYYSLTGDYGYDARAAMQRKAKQERAKRTRKAASKPASTPKVSRRAKKDGATPSKQAGRRAAKVRAVGGD